MPLPDLYLIANSTYYVCDTLSKIEIFINCNTQQFHAVNLTNNATIATKVVSRYIDGVTQPHGVEFIMVNR